MVGSLNVDLVVQAARRPDAGETLRGTASDTVLGGKGFNQAVAAARAGARVAMVGRVGADAYGASLRAALDAEGIDAAHVGIDPSAGTGVAAILVEEGGENSIVIVPRANEEVTMADLDAASAAIGGARVVLIQLELPFAVAVAAARIGHAAGATVVLNPAPAPESLTAFAGLVDIVVPNEDEAARLGGGLTGDVVVTRGARGADVYHFGDVVEGIPPHPVECVDTVGAGDAFCGALAAALVRGADLVAAARYGNAAGALAVTRPGASPSMPTAAEIEALLAAK